jgi:hypothetical protein
MSDDRRVKGRSDEEVRRIANDRKPDYRVSQVYPVNILRCLRSGSVRTLFGSKNLVFKIVDDNELGTVDAKTEYLGGTVTITCKRGVESRATLGVGRDRMTLAHELGHAVMHSGEPNFRHTSASGATSLSAITAYESAEHQAKVFASAFLIHDDAAAGMSAEEISEQFGVSLEAAKLCFDRLLKKAERAKSAARVLKMSEEVKAALLENSKPKLPTYLDEICIVCKQRMLVPNGNSNVSCDTCKFNGPRFQDGDKAA